MNENDLLNYIRGLIALFVIMTLIIFAAFATWLAQKFPEEEKEEVIFLIDYTEYGEYHGQKEIGDTNMIYHEFNEGSHTVRVMKDNVFSFEKYYDTRDEAILFMENYSDYIRRLK